MKVDLCVKKTCTVVTLTCEPFKSHDAEIGVTTVDDKGQEQAKPPDDEILQKYDVSYHLYNI